MKGIEITNTLTGEVKRYRSKKKMEEELKIGFSSITRALKGKPFWKKNLRHLTLKEY